MQIKLSIINLNDPLCCKTIVRRNRRWSFIASCLCHINRIQCYVIGVVMCCVFLNLSCVSESVRARLFLTFSSCVCEHYLKVQF